MTNYALLPVSEIHSLLVGKQQNLSSLAPYNGTVVGARAIAAIRQEIDALIAELTRRGALNDLSLGSS